MKYWEYSKYYNASEKKTILLKYTWKFRIKKLRREYTLD